MLKTSGKINASSFIDIYRRIQLATNTKTQQALANILGVHQSTISDAKRRNAIPPRWAITLFEKSGLNQDWLYYGTGPMYLRTELGYMPTDLPATAVTNPAHYGEPAATCQIVTVYSMYFQPNRKGIKLKTAGKLALPSSFIGPDVLVLSMRGNNMAPTIQSGAYFGVSTKDIQPVSGGIFVLRVDHVGLFVRRVFPECGSMYNYVLRSDNATHPESVMQPQEVAERIVGRVRWVMQEFAC